MKKSKVIALIVLVCLFIINTILVKLDLFIAFDEFIHDHVMLLFSDTTNKIMHGLTFLGSTLFIIGVVLVIFTILMLKKQNFTAYLVMAVIIISTLINNVIKLIIQRPRPEYMAVVENTFAYPSGHTMASASLYGLLIYLLLQSNLSKTNKYLYSLFLGLIIILIGLSRIYLGAHFASDVIGAFILSAIIVIIASSFFKRKMEK